MNKEIICPNCSQHIKILDTIGYDLYLENLKKEEREIERLKENEEYYRKGFAELYKRIEKAIEYINKSMKFRFGADIYQFVDIETDILEPIRGILEGSDKE